MIGRIVAVGAVVVLLTFGASPVPAQPAEQVVAFLPGLDRSAWYWAKQVAIPPGGENGLIPSPQRSDTLPVAVSDGARERVAAISFDLAARGVAEGSVLKRAILRIEEGSDPGEQPPIQPDLASLAACRVTSTWQTGEAKPSERAPSYDPGACVSGSPEDSLGTRAWVFDLTPVAAPWFQDPTSNHGVMILGAPYDLASGETWQVNLKLPVRDELLTPEDEFEQTMNRAVLSIAMEPPEPLPPVPPEAGYPAPGDDTGVTPESISIGVHASLTGAAVFPASSFTTGSRLYWDRGDSGEPVRIFGRRVHVTFQDDQDNPSHARQVCREMIEEQGVFLLVGFSEPDVNRGCAELAADRGVPYISLGTTEQGMRGLRNFFAVSQSWAQQGPLLAQFIRRNFTVNPQRVAMVATDVAEFDDAVDAFTRAFPGVTVLRPPKNQHGSASAEDLCLGPIPRYKVVYPLTRSSYFLQMSNAALCEPQYVGVGLTQGLDNVASAGCQNDGPLEGARFFSPAPAFSDAQQYEPLFPVVAGEEADDVTWLLWGFSKSIHTMLQAAGPGLDRAGFVEAAEGLAARPGIYPDLSFSRNDHFGALQVHALRVKCEPRGDSAGFLVTEEAFAERF